jgi:hypothetical protein
MECVNASSLLFCNYWNVHVIVGVFLFGCAFVLWCLMHLHTIAAMAKVAVVYGIGW